MTRLYDDLETMLADRGVVRRDDGSFAEDSYDYGVWWRGDDGRTYRLTWVGGRMREDEAKAGELYLVRLDGPRYGTIRRSELGGSMAVEDHLDVLSAGTASGRVEVLCVIAPACNDEHESIFDRERGSPNDPARTVEEILEGWAEVCGSENSVDWVRERAREAIAGGRATEPEGGTR